MKEFFRYFGFSRIWPKPAAVVRQVSRNWKRKLVIVSFRQLMRSPMSYVLVAEVSFVSSWQGSGNLLWQCHSSGVSKESRHLVKNPQQRGTIHPPLGRVQPNSSGFPGHHVEEHHCWCFKLSPRDLSFWMGPLWSLVGRWFSSCHSNRCEKVLAWWLSGFSAHSLPERHGFDPRSFHQGVRGLYFRR